MAGDKFNLQANSWYILGGNTPDAPVSPLSDIVSAIVNSVPGLSGGKITGSQLTSAVLNPSVSGFLTDRDVSTVTTRPKAYLNWILFDEQMNPILTNDGKNSGFQQVVGSGVYKTHTITDREITKNGYLYIYVSNETPNISVYFDQLQVTHIRGPLLQEEAYYPFGLEMKGISAAAATTAANRYKFNAGTELEERFNIDYYETPLRRYDAQVGRFTGVDMLAEMYANITPYQFGANNPISMNDPTGLWVDGAGSEVKNRSEKGPDGNYHVGWLNELMWNNVGFFDWGIGGAGANDGSGNNISGRAGGSGKFSNVMGVTASQVLSQMHFGDKFGLRNGKYGFWQSFVGESSDVSETGLAEVIVGTRFVEFDDNFDLINPDGGALSPRSFIFTESTGNMYEAGVSGLFYDIEIKTGLFSSYTRHVDFKNIYIGFPSSTKDDRTFSTRAAAILAADAFNDAAKSLALQFNFYSPEAINALSDNNIQNMFIAAAVFYMNTEIRAGGYVGVNKYGKNTITTPAVWGKY